MLVLPSPSVQLRLRQQRVESLLGLLKGEGIVRINDLLHWCYNADCFHDCLHVKAGPFRLLDATSKEVRAQSSVRIRATSTAPSRAVFKRSESHA